MMSGAKLKLRARGSAWPRAASPVSITLPDAGDRPEGSHRFAFLLRLHGVARVRQRLQARFGDRLPCVLTDAVGSGIELPERAFDCLEHLLDIAAHREIVICLLDATALIGHVIADALSLIGL